MKSTVCGSLFPDFVTHLSILRCEKAELCERSTSRNVITLVVISTAAVVFECRKCHDTFFFVLPSKRRKQRSEKNTRVCSTPHLMESCWKVHFEVLFGARGGFICCSFFLFHDRKSGRFSPTEKRVRAPWRIALFFALTNTERCL